MKKLGTFVAVLSLLSVLLMVGTFGLSARAQNKQQIVVHLTHYTDNLHAALMALRFAGAMQEKGAQVTLLLDVDGVYLADAWQPPNLRWLSEYYDAFVKAGGKVLVCPHCAMAARMESLRPGARMAEADDLANVILTADKILDY